MERTITNYSFLNEQGAMVDPNQKSSRKRDKYYLQGKLADPWMMYVPKENYRTTSWVKEINDKGEAITFDGGVYILKDISPEYKEFLDVSQRGVLTIANWNIHGTVERGYYLNADIVPQKQALTAKIVGQEGNFLIIRRLKDNEWQYAERVFVCWDSMHEQVVSDVKARGRLADIEYSHFERFNGIRCKPVLKLKSP